MAVDVGNIVRITCKMRLNATDDAFNVYHYRVDKNTTPDDLAFMTQMAFMLDANYVTINSDLSTLLTYVTIDGQNITKNELLPEVPWPSLVAGIQAGSLLPQQVAGYVFWPTTTPKVRSSAFLAGYTAACSTPTGDFAALCAGRVKTFGDGIQILNSVTVDATKGTQHAVSGVFTPAGVAVVPDQFRTQRRRRKGVGS